MKTVRNSKVGDLSLRLVQEDRAFIGLIFAADNSKKAQVEGTDADDVWRRLHDEAGKANPKYFGFDGARHASRASFPNGFHSKGYTNAERDYKIAAKQRLDETAPLERAVSEPGLGEATLAVFRATKAGELAELKPRDRIYVGAICLESAPRTSIAVSQTCIIATFATTPSDETQQQAGRPMGNSRLLWRGSGPIRCRPPKSNGSRPMKTRS